MPVYLRIIHFFCVRWDEIALHSVWMQHGDLFSNKPTLRHFAGKNALTTFQNFCGTIAQCFKISSHSTKTKKSLSLSYCIAYTYELKYSWRPSSCIK